MKSSYCWSPKADAEFRKYVQQLRRQPAQPGFPRKTFTELCMEQGIKPINLSELQDIARRYGLADDPR